MRRFLAENELENVEINITPRISQWNQERSHHFDMYAYFKIRLICIYGVIYFNVVYKVYLFLLVHEFEQSNCNNQLFSH